MLRLRDCFLACAISIISVSASASYICEGNVEGVTLNPKSGSVVVENLAGLRWVRLCSVSQIINGIPAESCKAIYSLLLTAQSTNKGVVMWFNDDKSCTSSDHPPWQDLTGWYFGPKLIN